MGKSTARRARDASLLRRCVAIGLVFLPAMAAGAQLKGDHIPGLAGLQSGTQAPPGVYAAAIGYNYSAGRLADANGHTIARPELSSWLTGASFAWVLPQKLWGANIGGGFLLALIQNQLESDVVHADGSFGLTDIAVSPLTLGWKSARADFLVGTAVYLPVGSYEPGGSDNHGLGMFGYEISAGATGYLDDQKRWHIAALSAYEFHGEKRDTDLQVGQILTVEGGVGYTALDKTAFPVPNVYTMGIAGYGQSKITHDGGSAAPARLANVSDAVVALGPEFSAVFPGQRFSVSARYLWEFDARVRFEGQTLAITVGYVAKSFPPRAP